MGLDPRVVGAPALATCVHVSLVFAKQALLPALLGDAYSPAALARLLGRLALCSAASALVCVPLATAAASATRRPKLVVVAAIAADAWVELRFAALARNGVADPTTLSILAIAHGVAAAIAPLAAAALATADDAAAAAGAARRSRRAMARFPARCFRARSWARPSDRRYTTKCRSGRRSSRGSWPARRPHPS